MKKNAFTLLTGILLLTAVMMMSLIMLSTMQSNINDIELYGRRYYELNSFASGCLEEGIIRLKRDSSFSAASLSASDASCTISAALQSADTYTLSVTAAATNGQSVSIQSEIQRTAVGQAVGINVISYSNI